MALHPVKPVSRPAYVSLRKALAIGLIITGVGMGLFGPVAFQAHLPVARAACSGQNLFLGSYYLLPDDSSHPDFEQVLQQLTDVPGQLQPNLVGGVPVPVNPNPPLNGQGQPTNTSIHQFDWYTPQYQIFTRLDNNPLAFSNDNRPGTIPYFGPTTQPAASAALPANKDLFTTQWHTNLVAPAGGLNIPYSFALDDAGWVFLDGQLQIDHGGIHPPTTFTGNFVIPAGPHVVDIFYADRHTVNAVTNFQLGNLATLADCGSPNLSLVKSVQPNSLVGPGDLLTYTVQVANTGNFTATNTIIRDTTPASTGFVSANPAPVSAPAGGGSGDVVWNLGTILPGQTQTLTFVVQVSPNTPPAIAISNAALGTSNESGGVVFKSNGVSNLVNATATLLVNKSAVPPAGSTVNIGSNVTYSIQVSNIGNVATGSVTVDDPLPPGTVFVSANPAPQAVQNGNVHWVLPALPPNDTATLSLTVQVISRLPNGLLQNRASAVSNNLSASSPLVTHTVQNAADTSINKMIQGFDAPLAPGSFITYTLSAANAGPSIANSVIVSDTLPPGLIFSSSTPPPTTNVPPNLTWNLGNLAAGQTSFITVVAQVQAGFPGPFQFSNKAGIQSSTPEIQPANNTSTADVPGGAAPNDASVSKSGPPQIAPNEVFIYQLLVQTVNGGDNIVVTDTLQPGLTLVPEQTTPPALGTGPTYYWNLGKMAPGTQQTIFLAVKATGVTPGTSITNTAQITYGTGPTRPTATSNGTNSQVGQGSNLSISKATTTSQFTPGGTVDFTIQVKNSDPVNASGGVTVSDTLPPGFVLQSSTPPVTLASGNTYFWRLTSVPAGGTATISLQVIVPANYSGPSFSNAASLQTDTPNADPNLNSPPVQVPRIGLTANLVVSKDSLTTSLKRGQSFAYTITVNNTGPIEAKDVLIQDPLPPGLTFISAQPAPTSQSPLTWKLGNLPANNGQASVTLLVKLDQNFSGAAISNSAAVSSLSGNSNQANSSVTKIIPIQAPRASATPAFTSNAQATAIPTPTLAAFPTSSASSTVTATAGTFTPTPTASGTTTPEVTATPATTESSGTPGEGESSGVTATATPYPGVPNTGKANPEANEANNEDWLGGFGSFAAGLALIGLGLLLLFKFKQREQ